MPSTKAKLSVPVDQAAAGYRIDITGKDAIDIDAPAVDRIVGCHDMLQRRLQVFVGIRRGQRGSPLASVLVLRCRKS